MTRRLYCKILLSVTAGMSLAANCPAEDLIAWGTANQGLRLGLAANLANGRLRLALRNDNTTTLDVLVGFRSGNGIAYGFTFTATAHDGTQLKVWDVRSESMSSVAGFLAPQLISVPPASTHEFAYPLNQLVYMAKERTVPLDSLLGQGYTVAASLALEQKDLNAAVMGHIAQPLIGRLWTGLVTCELPETEVRR